jgi:hypothetical protein
MVSRCMPNFIIIGAKLRRLEVFEKKAPDFELKSIRPKCNPRILSKLNPEDKLDVSFAATARLWIMFLIKIFAGDTRENFSIDALNQNE